jgi:hypothetical protein
MFGIVKRKVCREPNKTAENVGGLETRPKWGRAGVGEEDGGTFA